MLSSRFTVFAVAYQLPRVGGRERGVCVRGLGGGIVQPFGKLLTEGTW